MQAITQDSYGGADTLTLTTIEQPTPGPGQVLIEVHAAGVDRGTWHLMRGEPYLVRLGFGLRRPKQPTPGLDVAGRVVGIGTDVTRFTPGDDVFGIADGSFAEYAVADESKLSHKPEAISHAHAAASAVSGITAIQALTDAGRLEAGQRVLVVGASGGVGTFAVQLAKALGATVDAVAGTTNLDLVRSLGAENVFDHRVDDLDAIDAHYDLILDIGGRNPVRRLRRRLTPTGTLVLVGGEGGNRFTGGFGRTVRAAIRSPFVGHRLVMMISTEHHSFIDRLAEHLESGAVAPVISERFPLADAAAALRRMEAGQTGGKSVIVVQADVDETPVETAAEIDLDAAPVATPTQTSSSR